jgi:diacylglycerol kinase (ATP)
MERANRLAADGAPIIVDKSQMTDKNTFTFSGRIRSITFALRGIRIMVASQQNAWIHAAATVAVVAAGLFVRL